MRPRSASAAEARAICAGDLVAHFVAAGTDSRPDQLPRPFPEGGDARLDDPGEQADPAGVQQSKRGPLPFCRTRAIGRQSAESASSGTPRSSVHRPSPSRLRSPDCARFTSAECVWRFMARRVGIRSDRLAEPAAVLVDVLGVVVRA